MFKIAENVISEIYQCGKNEAPASSQSNTISFPSSSDLALLPPKPTLEKKNQEVNGCKAKIEASKWHSTCHWMLSWWPRTLLLYLTYYGVEMWILNSVWFIILWQFRTYRVKSVRGGCPLPIILCDTMGLEESTGEGLNMDDIISILKGHLQDLYQVELSVTFSRIPNERLCTDFFFPPVP